jgi:hypothetical protein
MISEDQRFEMELSMAAVDMTHARAENRETRSKLDIFNRTEAIRQAHIVFRRVIAIFVVNNTRATSEDFEALNVPRPGFHAPLPAPSSYPFFMVDLNTFRRLTIIFRDYESVKRGKPHGAHGAVIRWSILDSKPVDMDELNHLELATSSPHFLDFTEEQRGKRVYFCLAWQNRKGEKGPWSEISSSLIP